MGTPEFAVPSLRMLVENGIDVVGVITAPGQTAKAGAKKWAHLRLKTTLSARD